MVVGGLCWLAFAAAIGWFLVQYLAEGAGLLVFGFFRVSSTTVSMGLVHVLGFAAAASLCFLIGAGLCAHGLVPAPEQPSETAKQSSQGRQIFCHHDTEELFPGANGDELAVGRDAE